MHARTRRAPTRETAEPPRASPARPPARGRPAPGLSRASAPFRPGSRFSGRISICPDAVPPDVVRPVDLELLESSVEIGPVGLHLYPRGRDEGPLPGDEPPRRPANAETSSVQCQ